MATTITPALQAISDQRDQQYENATKKACPQLSCVVYLITTPAGLCAVGYRGRARKHAFRYRFGSEEERSAFVDKWMADEARSVALKRERQLQRSTVERQLNVDDVLVASWGWNRTNVNYYLVTALVGKASVELVEIQAEKDDAGAWRGHCIPKPEQRIGEPMRKRVNGTSVKISNVIRASLKPVKVVHGCRLYEPDSWSCDD